MRVGECRNNTWTREGRRGVEISNSWPRCPLPLDSLERSLECPPCARTSVWGARGNRGLALGAKRLEWAEPGRLHGK